MVVTPNEFPWEVIDNVKAQKRRRGNPGTRSKVKYADIITAFDIETTSLPDQELAFMYIWQWQIGEEYTVIGRTWAEFKQFRTDLVNHLHGLTLVAMVHNLSFEWQFIKGTYDFQNKDIFAVDPRRVVKCKMENGAIEFRCSYIMTNMSLAEFTRKMGVQHQKLSGDLDYSVIRYPWTELTDQEMAYCINDVQGLVEAVKVYMESEGDTFYTLPMTSTGFVRRDAKRAMQKCRHDLAYQIYPTWNVYRLLREAFRGGNTHASRFMAAQVIEDVSSADRSSSYPDVMVNCEVPMGRFFYRPEGCSIEELEHIINDRKKAVVMEVKIWGLELQDETWPCPYIARHKCRQIREGVFDNGRVLQAAYIETVVTDVDFRILMEEYEWETMVIGEMAYATYGLIPEPLADLTIDYYRNKTTLKGVKDQRIFYDKQKARLNSIYGMMAQDPVKEELFLDNGEIHYIEDQSGEKLLEDSKRKSFLCYQWGVWITAWARYRLEEGIRLAHDSLTSEFVYCDTDSVKYTGTIDWSEFNEARIRDSIESGAHATDPKGTEHYMGVFEFEEVYKKFSTLGAKKYCYENDDGKLHITIAGVGKISGAEELGSIEKFVPGFIFTEAGGTESVYNDHPDFDHITVEGKDIEITPYVFIRNSTYTLGITHEYEYILHDPVLMRRYGFKD